MFLSKFKMECIHLRYQIANKKVHSLHTVRMLPLTHLAQHIDASKCSQQMPRKDYRNGMGEKCLLL